MATVKIIKIGYSTWISPARQHADGTITLVRGKHNLIVDTGLPQDKGTILEELEKEGLAIDDIHYVVCTHGHSDHVGNNNLFPNATFVVSYDISNGDLYTFHDFSIQPYVIDDEIEIVQTPGHSYQDISVLVKTGSGTIAITGDLFEKKEDLENREFWKAFSEWPEKQIENRERILQIADFIVPGHGDIFPVISDNVEDFRAEKGRRKIEQMNGLIGTSPLEQIPIEDLSLVVEDAMRDLDLPKRVEKNPIDAVFPSLFSKYRRTNRAKFAVLQTMIKGELDEFLKATDIIMKDERRNLYAKLLNLRFIDRQTPEEIWKQLNMSKTPYYNHLKQALHSFAEFLRRREILERERKTATSPT
jgi:glyoxylase-like metal-dependent hydrolase (beta-lactamase superfamily II)